DSTGTALTFTTSVLPKGLAFDPVTRTIVGTVDYYAAEIIGGTPPSLSIKVTVTNGRGLSASQTFYWTILERDAPVSLGTVSPSRTIVTPHGIDITSPLSLNGTVTIQATDPDPCDELVFDWGPIVPIPGLQLTRIVPAPDSCISGRVFTGV